MTHTRRLLTVGLCLVAMGFALGAAAQNMRSEARRHPRIAAAIDAIQDAVNYLEHEPHDFGGHKNGAIRASRAAVEQLREALAYEAAVDRRR